MAVTDYADWGALAALQAFITDLNLASQTLQATATQIADEIEATGVPLLGQPSELYSAGSLAVAAGASGQVIDNSSSAAVTDMAGYLSYDVHIRAESNASSSSPFLTFTLGWYGDAAATLPMNRETWTMPCNSANGGTSVIGTGPVRGGYLQVSVTNEDATYGQTIAGLQLYGNSRPAPEPVADWRTYPIDVSVPGYTVPTYGQNVDGILGIFPGLVIAHGTTDYLLCGLFNGTASANFVVTDGTSPEFTITQVALISGAGIQALGDALAVTGNTSVVSYGARTPIIYEVENTSASNSVTLDVSVVAASRF